MDLYLIRHADALPLGERDIKNDEDRPLSAEGEAQCALLAAGLQRRGVRLDKIVSSPLLRARQTAESMLRGWSQPAPELLVREEAAPGVRSRKFARFLRELKEESVALVGHQPDLGKWAAWLVGDKWARIGLAKAGVAHITFDEKPDKGAGVLVWLVTPEWLR